MKYRFKKYIYFNCLNKLFKNLIKVINENLKKIYYIFILDNQFTHFSLFSIFLN